MEEKCFLCQTHYLDTQSIYCTKCGSKRLEENFCSKCNKKLHRVHNYCDICGAETIIFLNSKGKT